MKEFLNKYYQNHALIYKFFLFIVITVIIVYLFPQGGQFPYNIPKGKPWQYENLYAPFDFAILKTDEDLQKEMEEIEANKRLFFTVREDVYDKVEQKYMDKILLIQEDSAAAGLGKSRIKTFGLRFLQNVYKGYSPLFISINEYLIDYTFRMLERWALQYKYWFQPFKNTLTRPGIRSWNKISPRCFSRSWSPTFFTMKSSPKK